MIPIKKYKNYPGWKTKKDLMTEVKIILMVQMIKCRNCNSKDLKKVIFIGKQVVFDISQKNK